MEALIGLFWAKYNDLRRAVDCDDPTAVQRLDQELDPLLQAIVQHQVSDLASIQAQFRFALDLLQEEADDRGCVNRNGHLLQMLVERYLAPQIGRAATARVAGNEGEVVTVFETEDGAVLDPVLFDRIPERIMVVAPGYRVFYSNEPNAERLGQPKEKLLGRHFADLVGIYHFQRDLREPIDRCLAGECLSHTYAEQRDGATVVVQCRLSPCFSDATTQVGALVIMQEMADRRRPRAAVTPD
ncbi:PAS domain S-box-containing protein [Pseudorhizobium tarimense]|uniref:PAS domain S-box-containing protein n=1 Tax=Pseudorhizobium tarimense TaxID=1079109 RepID=A0ABV2H361_9HYPH|nr:PAS domain-containing protein [Pseudorhizobium tarimense]MCJ8518042.1 PAS domain-containing protein [Pseudorhizobium tarimense]